MRARVIVSLIVIMGIVCVSCSGKKVPVTVNQHTDLTHTTGIVPYQDDIFCATKGGLVKWELPEARYTIFTTLDGLPTNILNDIIVDGEGLLWIATVEGISSFDGVSFKNYGLSHGLPSVEVNDITLDGSGNLWAATSKGVVSFKGGRFTLLDDENGPGDTPVLCVYFDMGDNLWIGTDDNGVYFRTEGEWTHNTTKDGLVVNSVYCIVQAWDRSVWGATWAGVTRFDGRGWQTFSSMDQLGTYEASDLISTDKRLWYFTVEGVHASQGADWFHFTEDEGLISNDVTCGYVVSDDEVYIGTVDGMSVLKDGVIENYFVPNGPVGYNCISIMLDDRGRTWLGTWETGLNMHDSGYWTQLIGRNEKTLETVRSIVFGPDNGIVFNTMNGIVFEKENKWTFQTRSDGVSGNDVRCGVYDESGRYWAGTASGICYLDNGRWKRYRSIHGLPSEDTWSCAYDGDKTVWFGNTKGIVSFTDDVLTDRTSEVGLGEIDVRSIAVQDGRILFGTESGQLIEYDNGTWDVFSSGYLGTDKGIYAIAVASGGSTWFGTNGDGIIGFENGKKINITLEDGLPSNYVRALAVSGNTLWAACYGGTAEIKIGEE